MRLNFSVERLRKFARTSRSQESRPASSSTPDTQSFFATKDLKSLNQGDVIRFDKMPILGSDDHECPHGVAVISQTCDLRRGGTTVVVSKVVQTDVDPGRLSSWEQPRFVPLVQLPGHSVDLDCVASLHKGVGETAEVVAEFPSNDVEACSRFGRAIGRRFRRYAFPDEVVPWFDGLRQYMKKKAGKNSPLGRIVNSLIEIRVECLNDWNEAERDIVLHVIVGLDAMPLVDEDANASQELLDWLADEQQPTDLASRIETESDPANLEMLWAAFGESLATLCRPSSAYSATPDVGSAIVAVTASVSTTDDFTLTMHRRSTELDYDYLSELDESV